MEIDNVYRAQATISPLNPSPIINMERKSFTEDTLKKLTTIRDRANNNYEILVAIKTRVFGSPIETGNKDGTPTPYPAGRADEISAMIREIITIQDKTNATIEQLDGI